MPIVLISESLLLRSTAVDGRLLRDRVLCGFCVRMNARKRTFRIATSVAGKQFRMTLGVWPLMSVEDARQPAMEVLAECRAGTWPLFGPGLHAIAGKYFFKVPAFAQLDNALVQRLTNSF